MKTIRHYMSVAALSFRLSFQACMEHRLADFQPDTVSGGICDDQICCRRV